MDQPANNRPPCEVADILRAYGESFCRKYSPAPAQEKVMRHIIQCRTAALGGHLEQCDACGYQRISFHSCRDRHCPKCQSLARQEWLEKRLATLLPIPYFHIVFTIPHELNALALGNQTILFNILFASVAQTLQQVAATPRHLGAEIGFTAVLHTWGQNMTFHPHLHCVVTGGGLSPDHKSWIAAREKFFLPIPVLRLLFRGKFLAALRQAYVAGQLKLAGSTAILNQPSAWHQLLDPLYKKHWVVYAKAPFASPEYVFRYPGRYTHRVAIFTESWPLTRAKSPLLSKTTPPVENTSTRRWKLSSLFVAFYCMYCPKVSAAFVTSAYAPAAMYRPNSPLHGLY